MAELSQVLTMVKNISTPLRKDPRDMDSVMQQAGPLFKKLDSVRQRYSAHYELDWSDYELDAEGNEIQILGEDASS